MTYQGNFINPLTGVGKEKGVREGAVFFLGLMFVRGAKQVPERGDAMGLGCKEAKIHLRVGRGTKNPELMAQGDSLGVNGAREHSKMEWLDLKQLRQYAAISERTLRSWVHDTADPLPAYQVGTKILVRKRDFDSYVERHPLRPTGTLESLVNKILAEVVQK